jgi:tetratricopeptide (TPR) repeat protein
MRLLPHIAFFLFLCNASPAHASKLDSLLLLLHADKMDSQRVDHYNDAAKMLWKTGKYDVGRSYVDSAMSLAEKLHYKKGIASAWYNSGLLFQNQGNYPEALKNYFASLTIREKLGDKQGIANSYNTIGVIFWYEKNYEESLRNLDLSLKLKKEIGDETGLSTCYNNLGNVYSDQLKFDKALENYQLALAIKQKGSDKFGIANSYNNIGTVHLKLNEFADALFYLDRSLKLREELGDSYGITACNINIGNGYVQLKEFAKAKQCFSRSLGLSLKAGNRDGIRGSYEGLSALDTMTGDFRSAAIHYKLYILYRDSLLNEENTKKTVQAQLQYGFDKKSAADSTRNAELVKQEELKHEQEIAQQRTYTYGGLFGFLLMLIVSGVSFNAFRQKKKANLLISEQKKLVEEKQKEVLDSINYAGRIQRALLPSEKMVENALKRLQHP